MHKIKHTVPALLGINLILTIAVVVFLFAAHHIPETFFPEAKETLTYTLYIGLNDKDTYTQLISNDDARAIVDDICFKYVDAFTSSEARGSWTDESGVPTYENTLIYMFSDTSEEQITAIMDEVLTALNQSSILMSVDTVQTAYYSGVDNLQ